MDFKIDPEISAIVPEPTEVLATDERKVAEDKGRERQPWKPSDEWRKKLEASINATTKPVIQLVVWKSKSILIDGIERYNICKRLGIEAEFKIDYREFKDKEQAMQMRWDRNVKTLRHFVPFLRGEKIYRMWDKVFKPSRTVVAKVNKGGRGKKVELDDKVDQLGEQAQMAGVSRATMASVIRFLKYYDNPKSRMPKADQIEMLRCLRNGTLSPNSASANVVSFDARANRREMNRGEHLTKPFTPNRHVKTKWTGEANTVINNDVIATLNDIPNKAIDRFVFSPPYYLCDNNGNYVNYGEGYKPFESWNHYCNWTLRYLVKMWQILPRGGYLVINVDNTLEPEKIQIKDAAGKIIQEHLNPRAGLYYYHTDLIRYILRHIDMFCNEFVLNHFYEDESLNPIPGNSDPFYEIDGLPGTVLRNPSGGDYFDGSRFHLHPFALPPEVLGENMLRLGSYGHGPGAVDCGEYIWAKTQATGKKEPMGGKSSPHRRRNHEYVLFFRKGEASEKASLMRPVDLKKGTISTWEDSEPLDPFEEKLFESYWKIASTPDLSPEHRHQAKFPEKLAIRMVIQGAGFGDVICDPFCGTGTTLYFAARRGFKYVGIEQNPAWAARAQRYARRGETAFEAEQRQNLVSL